MSNGSNKIKILFPILMSNSWIGGLNYYKNLFKAISMINNPNVELYVPENNPSILFEYAKPIKQKKKDFKYHIAKFWDFMNFKKFNSRGYLLDVNQFDIISHSEFMNRSIPTIAWIPDFQHIYLKNMFSTDEIENRNKSFQQMAQNSTCVILSSQNAKADFEKLYPECKNKARVLNFVSYIDSNIYNMSVDEQNEIKRKFNLPSKYFYIPNQFWKHKNHITAFKAIKTLKDKNVNVHLVCSGFAKDYRSKNYFDDVLMSYIKENNLEDNIHFLGVVNLEEVYYLMRNCVSVINPSLFEGWSSTVEEAKSLGKNIILSDLDVHKEQNPPECKYFKREDYNELAHLMEEDWWTLKSEPNLHLEEFARKNLDKRMIDFGQNYLSIVREILKKEIL